MKKKAFSLGILLTCTPSYKADAFVFGALSAAKKLWDKRQLDRIELKQKTALAKQVVTLKALGETLKEAKKMSDKIKRFDDDAQRSKKRAEILMKTLRGDPKRIAATYFERAVGMPINPGFYIPNTKWGRKLKKNMDKDLLGPQLSWRERVVLSDTVGAVCREVSTMEKLPENVNERLEEAEAYNRIVDQSLDAKNVVRAKRYQAELNRLAQEIATYEGKRSSGESMSAVELYALEQVLETKRMALNRLELMLDEAIKKGLNSSKTDRRELNKKYKRAFRSQFVAFINAEKERMRG